MLSHDVELEMGWSRFTAGVPKVYVIKGQPKCDPSFYKRPLY